MRHLAPLPALVAVLALTQCGPATPAATSPVTTAAKAAPTTYVLVHGALLGELSWKPVQDRLTADGNIVITLDLPAHGADATPTEKATLDGYRDAVVRAIGAKTNVVPLRERVS